jgi:hypothetical protein
VDSYRDTQKLSGTLIEQPAIGRRFSQQCGDARQFLETDIGR